jgi:hypothetical protein
VENLTDSEVMEYVTRFERQLSKSNWQKDTRKKTSINNILQNEGIKDYAYYMYHSERPLNGVSEYELVLTAFVDANVRCKPASETTNKNCKNRFVRIGVNKL